MWSEKEAYIKTEVQKSIGSSVIEIRLSKDEKKRITINGMQINRMGELMGHLNSVIFSPEDLKLIKEGPIERRRYIDMGLSQVKPKYFYYLQQYNRVLNQRNNLLKSIKDNHSLKKTLSVWNHQIAEVGSYIILERLLFCSALKKITHEIHKELSYNTEDLSLEYSTSIPVDDWSIDNIKQKFQEALEESEQKDIERGSTSIGCHRDDIKIMINGKNARIFGSQGQQRTGALSLKLSVLDFMKKETGEYPILLLDDVMSELDSHRQRMLLDYISKVQTFITTTDIDSIKKLDHIDKDIYLIDNGRIKFLDKKLY